MQSGIHGWGLFARKAAKQDSMIIEYRGDVVTRTVSELREHKYRAAGIDCYLFNINDELVVDATMRGTIGRFTVSRPTRIGSTSKARAEPAKDIPTETRSE